MIIRGIQNRAEARFHTTPASPPANGPSDTIRMKTTYIPLLIIATILAAATWTARITARPASAMATIPAAESSPPAAPVQVNPSADQSALSPIKVAKAIHAARTSRDRASEVGAYIVESRREQITHFLAAVDDVIAADESLHERVQKTLGASLPGDWNLRVIGDNLGLFSTNVSFIGQSISGFTARVTIQEGKNVPLLHARFVREDGRWLHEPDPIPAGVVPALIKVAEVIRDVEKSVEEGAPFESLSDAFTFRILPKIKEVARAGRAENAE